MKLKHIKRGNNSGLRLQSSEVQMLVNLGLTSAQARIYLNLVKTEPSNVTIISEQPEITKTRHEKNMFVLNPQKDAVIEQVKQTAQEAKKSIDFITPWKHFSIGERWFSPEKLSATVPCRCILAQLTKKDAKLPINAERNLAIRFIPNQPKAVLGIFDKKEVVIIEDQASNLRSPALWTNNPSIVIMAQTYFDNLWLKATEEPEFKNNF